MQRPGYERLVKPLWLASVGAVVYLSLMPGSNAPTIAHLDKVQHLVAYAWLAGLQVLAFPARSGKVGTGMLWLILLGAGLEVAQSLVPGRFPSVLDLLANSAGVVLGHCAGSFLAHRGRRAQNG